MFKEERQSSHESLLSRICYCYYRHATREINLTIQCFPGWAFGKISVNCIFAWIAFWLYLLDCKMFSICITTEVVWMGITSYSCSCSNDFFLLPRAKSSTNFKLRCPPFKLINSLFVTSHILVDTWAACVLGSLLLSRAGRWETLGTRLQQKSECLIKASFHWQLNQSHNLFCKKAWS